ncbi:hypothetical protein [Holospora curviuscula]|uniref:Uncharacterized protein n=1 Tax=Holospora curviuscula TaxID=1082868 RepID=A0A2S5R771_9PROT|nr:hypothetical protein [Holospora curviuscula]PPE02975.1 hypothetical protein HCUR_01583 [Holospora curviuscula]
MKKINILFILVAIINFNSVFAYNPEKITQELAMIDDQLKILNKLSQQRSDSTKLLLELLQKKNAEAEKNPDNQRLWENILNYKEYLKSLEDLEPLLYSVTNFFQTKKSNFQTALEKKDFNYLKIVYPHDKNLGLEKRLEEDFQKILKTVQSTRLLEQEIRQDFEAPENSLGQPPKHSDTLYKHVKIQQEENIIENKKDLQQQEEISQEKEEICSIPSNRLPQHPVLYFSSYFGKNSSQDRLNNLYELEKRRRMHEEQCLVALQQEVLLKINRLLENAEKNYLLSYYDELNKDVYLLRKLQSLTESDTIDNKTLRSKLRFDYYSAKIASKKRIKNLFLINQLNKIKLDVIDCFTKKNENPLALLKVLEVQSVVENDKFLSELKRLTQKDLNLQTNYKKEVERLLENEINKQYKPNFLNPNNQ